MTESVPATSKEPSVSIRRGIALGFSAPYEDTDTLVLTSPAGRFVDVRFPLLFSSSDSDHSLPYTRHPSFWAFAGRSSSTKPQKGCFPAWHCASHCVWTHEIDSRGEGVRDEGDMFDLANGDSMEVGVMRDAATGREEWYKEYWTSPEAEGEGGSLLPCLVAEAVADGADGEEEVAWGKEKGRLKGRIVRVGRRCQGIVEVVNGGVGDDGVLVERWASKDGGPEPWWVRQEPGRGEVAPDGAYSWILSDDRQLGDEMKLSDPSAGPQRWNIVECLR